MIGEAAARLGSEAVLIAADIPWREIRDLGNLLRHAYDRVDLEIIWRTVTDDLPALKRAVLRALPSRLGMKAFTEPRGTLHLKRGSL